MIKINWKKGRGKLGVLQPLLGQWVATDETSMGPVKCTRTFEKVLSGKYIQLTALWEYEKGSYEEIAYYGKCSEADICFWSFTSDGKHSYGQLADVSDINPEAIGFEAQMDVGLARMAYWPHDDEGFNWVVESKTKKGWNRFTQHYYLPLTKI